MNLFRLGNFALASGAVSPFKIECDSLTTDDWDALAMMASKIVPAFRVVFGVPTGGLRFQLAMNAYRTSNPFDAVLIVDDVLTTGGSMERQRAQLRECYYSNEPVGNIFGVCAFARGKCPDWVAPLFQMPSELFLP